MLARVQACFMLEREGEKEGGRERGRERECQKKLRVQASFMLARVPTP
jgi:hypothetical protein